MEEFLFNYSAGSKSPRSRLEMSGSLPSAARSGTQVPVTDLLRDYRGNWGFAAAGQAVPVRACHGDGGVEKGALPEGRRFRAQRQTGRKREVSLYASGESGFTCFLSQL